MHRNNTNVGLKISIDYIPEIEGKVAWNGGGDASSLAGKAVRLRLALMDADLYALKFNK